MRPVPASRLLATVAAALAALALGAASASAAVVRLASDSFTVDESAGAATITVVRTSGEGRGEVRYGVWYDRSATPHLEYAPVSGRVDFAPGQTRATFTIPIFDDEDVEGNETVKLGIYGAWPMKLGTPNRARLTIVDNDTIKTVRDPVNPLGLDPPPTGDNPLQGARFFVDEQWGLVNRVAQRLRKRNPGIAAKLRVIADQPETKRFGAWDRSPRKAVATYLQRVKATDPGAIPLISTYRLKHVRCGGYADSPREVERYKRWYEQFAQGIGNHRVVLFYEIDALITAKCLSRVGLQRRIDELSSTIDVLSRLPHAVVYVDSGASDAHTPAFYARLLRRIGVHKIQGFFTNSTHQVRTKREIRFARTIVRMLGGKPHYVINTATNGRGPLIPRDRVRYGNSFRCNAPGRGLGPRPTWDVPAQYKNLDALIWIGNPGRSAGRCARFGRAPPTGTFWLEYALSLIDNADFRIT